MVVQLARVRTDVFVIYVSNGIEGRGDYERYDCSATYGTIVGAEDGKHRQRHSKAVVSSHTFFMTIA